MRAVLPTLAVAMLAARINAQSVRLQTAHDQTAVSTVQREAVPAMQQAIVEATVQLAVADQQQRGEVWLELSADTVDPAPAHIRLRIPVSSTGDVYGESRSCTVRPGGGYDLTFTAGMDEANFIEFAPADQPRRVSFLLNKYLCRALAAPFQCGSAAVAPTHDWTRWRLGSTAALTLSSAAPSTLAVSSLQVSDTDRAFDPASCAVIAPSQGLCCVGGRTTEWHCGGTPAGNGWHQVSGECFHRDAGSTCSSGDTLTLKP